MERTKWFERKFTFDFPEGWIFNILERLRGTPFRISALVAGVSDEAASEKPGGKWSIKEHIGHLYNLDDLHIGRVDDFLAGSESLRAADLANTLTNEAHHNDQSVDALVKLFVDRRKILLTKLESLDDQAQLHSALHPRLKVMMRPVDMAYFIAEHDDHHLASIREIVAGSKE